jgi:hypothetical protein
MAAKKDSGADWNSGNERMRSSMSSGMSRMADLVSGEGRTGLAGFVSELKDRMRDTVSESWLEPLA